MKAKYKGMFYHGLKSVQTNKTTRCLRQPGRRIFGKSAEKFMEDYTKRLAFRPRG